MTMTLAQRLGIARTHPAGWDLLFDPNDFGAYLDTGSQGRYDDAMTKNESPKGNAAAASRYAAETNAMTFAPAAHPARRSGKVRTARHAKHRAIR